MIIVLQGTGNDFYTGTFW